MFSGTILMVRCSFLLSAKQTLTWCIGIIGMCVPHLLRNSFNSSAPTRGALATFATEGTFPLIL